LLGLVVRLITLGPRQASGEPRLSVHFIDVGPGDCTLISTPDNRIVLIDAGNADRSDHLISYLARQGVPRIDLLVIAHSDEDHIGGLPAVLDRFGISEVLDAAGPSGSATYEQVISSIRQRRIEYKTTAEERKLNVSNCVDFEVIWPLEGGTGDPIVMRFGYRDIGFLLTGNLSPESEARLLAEYHDLRSTVLKVANHGDSGATSNEFLQIVKPEYAVISADAESESAQPGEETLDRLSAAGSKVFRTDKNGDIVISTDGRRVWTECSE
jgi:competence protein ComEC